MPSFVPNGPLVPDELVQDLEDDRVVIFCGAGISRGAGLPDFNGLVRDSYKAMGVPPPSKRDRRWLWPDRMLGDLEARSLPGAVRAVVAEILGKPPKDVELHQALLRLAKLSRNAGLRLVTTNFDIYFEYADQTLRPGIDVHSGPILPIPRDDRSASWRSVVYLHGRLEPPAQGNEHLIMTSADFGRAYLTEGWAARFVGRLFADFSVIFVGYSLNDPVLRYMTDAFAAEARVARRTSMRPQAYIFVSYTGTGLRDGALEDWRNRGLEPIFYHYGRRHRLLRETVIAWAAARDDWLSNTATLIGRLAGSPPQVLTPSDIANLLWALFGRPLDDGYGIRVLAELNPRASVDWLQIFESREADILEDYTAAVKRARLAGAAEPPQPALVLRMLAVRHGHAEPSLSKASFHLARWITNYLGEDAAIDWAAGLAGTDRRLHPGLRDLVRDALSGPSASLSASKMRFWRLVSSEAPWMAGGPAGLYISSLPELLRQPGNDNLFQVELAAAMRPIIRLAPSIWRLGWRKLMEVDRPDEAADLDDSFSRLAKAEIDLLGGDGVRYEFAEFNGLPNADDRLAAMADELTSLLKLALDLWALVDAAGPDDDPSLYHQPSIVPHPQNRHFHNWTTLIDLLWRAWCRIDEDDCEASRCLVLRWRTIKYPTFRRMALAAIGQSACWTANEKLEALLIGL